MNPNHPVVIIGAGPIGLAAAAHAVQRELTPLLLEAGAGVGAGVLRWGHVRMFSPWRFSIDRASKALLLRHGWNEPDGDAFPTGRELVEHYLRPLARTPELAARIRLSTRVLSVTRQMHDRMKDGDRHAAPFVVRVSEPAGEKDLLACAVIDASGTIDQPSPLGASGIPAIGERSLSSHIAYGMPDVLGVARARYAGQRVVVVGSGHSALNVLLDLARLAEDEPATRVTWVVRGKTLPRVLGGGAADQLEERGKLGLRVSSLLDRKRLTLVTDFHVDRLVRSSEGIIVQSGERTLSPVDEIVAATGFRPDWSILSELRLDLDPAVESPRALAPLINPNVHSCGTVPPHGAEQLKHPDSNVFIVGMKSYGRAPTFLTLTGYEQVRSVVSAIAGDWEGARRVELTLPETGVCSTDTDARTCCTATVAVPSQALSPGVADAQGVPVILKRLSGTKASAEAASPPPPTPASRCC